MGLPLTTSDNSDMLYFETFIGKHIDQIKKHYIGLERSKAFPKRFRSRFKGGYHYFGRPYFGVRISVDDQDIIQEIEIYSQGHIGKPFYELFSVRYGLASEFLVVDRVIIEEKEQVIEEEESENDDLSSIQIDSTTTTTKPGSFEDEPILLNWKKDNYDIMIWLRSDKCTIIKFTMPKD